jgi:hypothetical protein
MANRIDHAGRIFRSVTGGSNDRCTAQTFYCRCTSTCTAKQTDSSKDGVEHRVSDLRQGTGRAFFWPSVVG